MAPRTRGSSNNNQSTGTHTVADCLTELGISDTKVFADCNSLEDEFQVVKQIYFAGASLLCGAWSFDECVPHLDSHSYKYIHASSFIQPF